MCLMFSCQFWSYFKKMVRQNAFLVWFVVVFFVCLFVFDQAAGSVYLLQCELDNVRDIRMKMDWTKYFINAIGDLVMLRQKPLETGICSDHVI